MILFRNALNHDKPAIWQIIKTGIGGEVMATFWL